MNKNTRNWGIFGTAAAGAAVLIGWIVGQHTKEEVKNLPPQEAAWEKKCRSDDWPIYCAERGVKHADFANAISAWREIGYNIRGPVFQDECPDEPGWITFTIDPLLDTAGPQGGTGTMDFIDMDDGPASWGITNTTYDESIKDGLGRYKIVGSRVRVHKDAGKGAYTHEIGHTLGWPDWKILPQTGHTMNYHSAGRGDDTRSLDCISWR